MQDYTLALPKLSQTKPKKAGSFSLPSFYNTLNDPVTFTIQFRYNAEKRCRSFPNLLRRKSKEIILSGPKISQTISPAHSARILPELFKKDGKHFTLEHVTGISIAVVSKDQRFTYTHANINGQTAIFPCQKEG